MQGRATHSLVRPQLSGSPAAPHRTSAGGRVRLPEEAGVQLHTRDLLLSLELIPRVALEGDGVPGLSAVAVAGAVLGHTWVVAGGRHRGCKDETRTGHTIRKRAGPCSLMPGTLSWCGESFVHVVSHRKGLFSQRYRR